MTADGPRFTLEVRDSSLARLDTVPMTDVTDFAAVKRRGLAGEWAFTLPTSTRAAGLLARAGGGIIASLDGDPVLSGPVKTFKRTRDPGKGIDSWAFNGVDDVSAVWAARGWPQPSNGDVTTQTVADDSYSGVPVETAMLALLSANLGPTAPAGRRDTRLVLPASQGRGGTVAATLVRFDVLGEVLAKMGAPAGMYLDVVQSGQALAVRVVVARDITRSVRFDVLSGTADSYEYTVTAPAATVAIVGGDGQDAARVLRAVTTPASGDAQTAWGQRMETFVDATSAGTEALLAAAGVQALADAGRTTLTARVVPVDTRLTRYRRDWDLGDTVAVVVPDLTDPATGGPVVLTETIEEVQLTYGAGGFLATATLGNPSLASQDRATVMYNALRDLRRRTSQLERRK